MNTSGVALIRSGFNRFAAGLLIVGWGGVDALAAELERPQAASPGYATGAPELVQAALEAELAGDLAGRKELVEQSLDSDADFAPARWQKGEIKFNGKWKSPEEIASLVKRDPRWAEYRKLRDAGDGSMATHASLAQWCKRQGLADEERYHWANVLLAAPGHQQARERLGLRPYQGGLYTDEEIAKFQEGQQAAKLTAKQLKPRLVQLCKDATGAMPRKRDQALAEIRQISDPQAIEPLQAAIFDVVRKGNDRFRQNLTLALVGALANMPQHEVTLHLLKHAVYSKMPEVRQAAAEALRPRAATDYVPLLMAALQAPVDVDVDVVTAPDGMVRMVETVRQQGPVLNSNHVRSTNFEVEGALTRDHTTTDTSAVLNGHLGSASSRAASTQARAKRINARSEKLNGRIRETLKVATGMDHGDSPEAWWAAWREQNELSYMGDQPSYDTYVEETYTFAYEQAPPSSDGSSERRVVQPVSCECFAPGTPVWTQAGLTAIEQIKIGDLVLSQDPTTGELAYRPVVETTVGPLSQVVALNVGDEQIVSTLGHRFWVNGQGWAMAKELQASSSLHVLAGAVDLKAIEPAGDMECHNLIVDGFHTFFVGESRVLVHDKTCPQPTLAVTPGLPSLEPPTEPTRSVTELLSASE